MIEQIAENDKKALLKLARMSINNNFKHLSAPQRPEGTEILDAPCGAFVTLHKKGKLRGCIGQITASQALWKTVRDVALSSAFQDTRFAPLKEKELTACDIEISVLSPFEQCPDPKKIEVGKHGLMVKKGYFSGLLLPQVPIEWGWNREEFLDHTCNKAGLPAGSWKDESTTILWFTAIVFGENDFQ